jgi:hypothetical protein
MLTKWSMLQTEMPTEADSFSFSEGRARKLRFEMLFFDFYAGHLREMCQQIWKTVDGSLWDLTSGEKYMASISHIKKSRMYPDLKEMVERGRIEDWDITLLSQFITNLHLSSNGKAVSQQIVTAVESLNSIINGLVNDRISDDETFASLWNKTRCILSQLFSCSFGCDDTLESACCRILSADSDELERWSRGREYQRKRLTEDAIAWLHYKAQEQASKISNEVETVKSILGHARNENRPATDTPEYGQQQTVNAEWNLYGQPLMVPEKFDGDMCKFDKFAQNQLALEISKSVQTAGSKTCGGFEESSLCPKETLCGGFKTSIESTSQVPMTEDLPTLSDFQYALNQHHGRHVSDGDKTFASLDEIDFRLESAAIQCAYPASENKHCVQLLETQVMGTLSYQIRETFKQTEIYVKHEQSLAALMKEIVELGIQVDSDKFHGASSQLINIFTALVQAGMVSTENQLRFWRLVVSMNNSELKYLEIMKKNSEQGMIEVVQIVPTSESHVVFVRMPHFAAEAMSCVLHKCTDLRSMLRSGGINLIAFESSYLGIVSTGSSLVIPPSLLQYSLGLANRNQALQATVERLSANASPGSRNMASRGCHEPGEGTWPTLDRSIRTSVKQLYDLNKIQGGVLLEMVEMTSQKSSSYSTAMRGVKSKTLDNCDQMKGGSDMCASQSMTLDACPFPNNSELRSDTSDENELQGVVLLSTLLSISFLPLPF